MSEEDSGMEVRPFAAVLAEVRGGSAHARVSALLADVSQAVAATGKKGKLTLTLDIAPVPNAAEGTLMVTVSSVAKIPEPDDATPTTVFFASDNGNLRRDDPRQQQLPLVGLPTRKEYTA